MCAIIGSCARFSEIKCNSHTTDIASARRTGRIQAQYMLYSEQQGTLDCTVGICQAHLVHLIHLDMSKGLCGGSKLS